MAKTQPIKGKKSGKTAKRKPLPGKIVSKKRTNKSSGIAENTSNRRQNSEKFGTSKLEADFARDFLDKLGVKYIYEYEAKDIHRFYDFAVVLYQDIPWIMENKQGVNCVKQEGQNVIPNFFIEIDGGYW